MRIAWQILMAAMIAAALAFLATTFTSFRGFGDYGLQVHRVPGGVKVDSVDAGGAAEQAGIAVGDILTIDNTFAARVMWQIPRAGETATTYVGDAHRPVQVTAKPASFPLYAALLSVSISLAFLIVGALVAWRKADDAASRALATFLICFGLGMNINGALFNPLWLRFFAAGSTESIFLIGGVAMLLFSCRFPSIDNTGYRATLAKLVAPVAVGGLLLSWVRLGAFYIGGVVESARILIVPYVAYYALIILAALFAFVISIRKSTGAERVQLRWVLWSFGAGFSGLIASFIAIVAGINPATAQLPTLTIVLIPIGLGYLILRHRVLDITFVINRAVVYGAVSLIMVTVFIVFEWVVGNLVTQGTGASLALNVVGAIALGFSVRYIHDRVDKRIDDLFFRERHLAEAAIRRFGHESALITEVDDLIQKTVDVAQRNAKLEAAAFYALTDGRFTPRYSTFAATEAASENDYAVLDMRTWHRPIDLMEFETSVAGEYAFPMIVRGQLAGFLACGAKVSHEALAPDERDALATLARDCGIALDSLRVHYIERELTEARAALAALVAAPKPQL